MAIRNSVGYTDGVVWGSMILRGLAMLGAAVAVLGVGYACFPTTATLVAGVEWLQTAGPIGYAVFVLGYGLHTVLMLPASSSHATAGFLYGPLLGPLIASACATGFSALNFFLGRTLLRGWVEGRIAQSPKLTAIDTAIGTGGAWMVFLLRLPPLSPFNPMSYMLGATRVRFRDFLLGTWLGGLLPIAVFGWLGASATSIAALFSGELAAGKFGLQVGGLVLTLLVTATVTVVARRAVDRALVQA